MSKPILVTGATGTVGGLVADMLDAADAAFCVGLRDPAAWKGPGEPVYLDYEDTDSVREAVADVDCIFLNTPLTPGLEAMTQTVADAAERADVDHIVKLSVLGCDVEPIIQIGRWHRAAERRIEDSGIGFTFLRPNSFMDNFIHYYPPDDEGRIQLPFGDGQVSWVDARDIAEVAVEVLSEYGHTGKIYSLTGPEALGIAECADHIAEATGREIRYVDVPEDTMRRAMDAAELPTWMIDAMLELHALSRAGEMAETWPDVERVLGRSARTFARFAADHADAWRID